MQQCNWREFPPAHLSLEQCSSQATAQYKAEIIANLLCTEQEHPAKDSAPAPAATFTDLTGGFGIDCAYLSSRFGHATYVERQETLCLMAGPSSLSIIMLHASQTPDSISQMTYAGAIVTAWFLSGMVLFIAQKFLRLLGEKGTIALERMMGMVLIMISVQMFMNGLAGYGVK